MLRDSARLAHLDAAAGAELGTWQSTTLTTNLDQTTVRSGRWVATLGKRPEMHILGAKVDTDFDLAHAPNYGFSLSPDRLLIAVPGGLGTDQVRVLDTRTGRLVRSFVSNPAPEPLMGSRDTAFSPDGTAIALADRDGHMRVWTLADHTLRADHAPGLGITIAVDWSASTLVALFEKGDLRRYDAEGVTEVAQLEPELGLGWDVQISPDDTQLVVSGRESNDPAWVLLDLASGAILGRGAVESRPAYRVGWSPDGRRFAVPLGTGDTWIVDPADPAGAPTVLVDEKTSLSVNFSPDGKVLVVAKGEPYVHLWAADSGEQFATLRTPGVAAVNEAQYAGDWLFLSRSDERIERLRLDPPAASILSLGTLAVSADRELETATLLLDRRQWPAAATIYARHSGRAPVLDRAAALLAAGRLDEAVALRDDLLRAGVLPGTLEVWLSP